MDLGGMKIVKEEDDAQAREEEQKMNKSLQAYKDTMTLIKLKMNKADTLIRQYNDKMKECDVLTEELASARNEKQDILIKYNLTMEKVANLELTNIDYKQDIDKFKDTADKQKVKLDENEKHMDQLLYKLKDMEEQNLLLEDNIKTLQQDIKTAKSLVKSEKKPNVQLKQQASQTAVLEKRNSSVNTDPVKPLPKKPEMRNKRIMTDQYIHKDNEPFPIFCTNCETRISPAPVEQILKIMSSKPPLLSEHFSPPNSPRLTKTNVNVCEPIENNSKLPKTSVDKCEPFENNADIIVQNNEDILSHFNSEEYESPIQITKESNYSSFMEIDKLTRKINKLESLMKKRKTKKEQKSCCHQGCCSARNINFVVKLPSDEKYFEYRKREKNNVKRLIRLNNKNVKIRKRKSPEKGKWQVENYLEPKKRKITSQLEQKRSRKKKKFTSQETEVDLFESPEIIIPDARSNVNTNTSPYISEESLSPSKYSDLQSLSTLSNEIMETNLDIIEKPFIQDVSIDKSIAKSGNASCSPIPSQASVCKNIYENVEKENIQRVNYKSNERFKDSPVSSYYNLSVRVENNEKNEQIVAISDDKIHENNLSVQVSNDNLKNNENLTIDQRNIADELTEKINEKILSKKSSNDFKLYSDIHRNITEDENKLKENLILNEKIEKNNLTSILGASVSMENTEKYRGIITSNDKLIQENSLSCQVSNINFDIEEKMSVKENNVTNDQTENANVNSIFSDTLCNTKLFISSEITDTSGSQNVHESIVEQKITEEKVNVINKENDLKNVQALPMMTNIEKSKQIVATNIEIQKDNTKIMNESSTSSNESCDTAVFSAIQINNTPTSQSINESMEPVNYKEKVNTAIKENNFKNLHTLPITITNIEKSKEIIVPSINEIKKCDTEIMDENSMLSNESCETASFSASEIADPPVNQSISENIPGQLNQQQEINSEREQHNLKNIYPLPIMTENIEKSKQVVPSIDEIKKCDTEIMNEINILSDDSCETISISASDVTDISISQNICEKINTAIEENNFKNVHPLPIMVGNIEKPKQIVSNTDEIKKCHTEKINENSILSDELFDKTSSASEITDASICQIMHENILGKLNQQKINVAIQENNLKNVHQLPTIENIGKPKQIVTSIDEIKKCDIEIMTENSMLSDESCEKTSSVSEITGAPINQNMHGNILGKLDHQGKINEANAEDNFKNVHQLPIIIGNINKSKQTVPSIDEIKKCDIEIITENIMLSDESCEKTSSASEVTDASISQNICENILEQLDHQEKVNTAIEENNLKNVHRLPIMIGNIEKPKQIVLSIDEIKKCHIETMNDNSVSFDMSNNVTEKNNINILHTLPVMTSNIEKSNDVLDSGEIISIEQKNKINKQHEKIKENIISSDDSSESRFFSASGMKRGKCGNVSNIIFSDESSEEKNVEAPSVAKRKRLNTNVKRNPVTTRKKLLSKIRNIKKTSGKPIVIDKSEPHTVNEKPSSHLCTLSESSNASSTSVELPSTTVECTPPKRQRIAHTPKSINISSGVGSIININTQNSDQEVTNVRKIYSNSEKQVNQTIDKLIKTLPLMTNDKISSIMEDYDKTCKERANISRNLKTLEHATSSDSMHSHTLGTRANKNLPSMIKFQDNTTSPITENESAQNIRVLNKPKEKKKTINNNQDKSPVRELRSRQVVINAIPKVKKLKPNKNLIPKSINETNSCLHNTTIISTLNQYLSNSNDSNSYQRKHVDIIKLKKDENFIKEQLTLLIKAEHWTTKINSQIMENLVNSQDIRSIAMFTIEYAVTKLSEEEEFDKSHTPPAPMMTRSEQKLVTLILSIDKKYSEFSNIIIEGIQYKLFRLASAQQVQIVERLFRLLVVLNKIKKDREKVRIFCCDALYCLNVRAMNIIYVALTCWPEIFPKHDSNNDIIVKTIVHIVMTLQVNNSYPKLNSLRKLLSTYYEYPNSGYTTNDFKEELLKNLQENVPGINTAILLLCKKMGPAWALENVINGLKQMIVTQVHPSLYEALSLLGNILRSFPTTDPNNSVGEIINQLCDVLAGNAGSDDLQEGVVSCLLSISKFKYEQIARSVIKWQSNKDLHPITKDKLNSFFKQHDAKWWWKFIKCNFPLPE